MKIAFDLGIPKLFHKMGDALNRRKRRKLRRRLDKSQQELETARDIIALLHEEREALQLEILALTTAQPSVPGNSHRH